MEKIKKKYKKKNKDPFYKKRVLWIFILAFTFIFGLTFIFFYDSFYQLETINIEGAKLTSKSALRSKIKRNSTIETPFFDSQSLIFLPVKRLEKSLLSSLPHLESLEIKRVFPDKLIVKLKERRADFIWCSENSECFEVDLSGVAFKGIEDKSNKIIVIDNLQTDFSLGDKLISKSKIQFINKANFELKDNFDYKTEQIYFPDERSVFMELERGFQIKLDFRSDLEDQLKRLELLLDEEIEKVEDLEYIELRYGNQVFYKYE